MSDSGTGTLGIHIIYGIVIVFLIGLVAVSVFTQGFGIIKPNVQIDGSNQTGTGSQTETQSLPDAELKVKLQNYINENLLGEGYTAEVTKLEPYDSHIKLAELNIKQGSTVLQTAEAYITNDGKSMFIGEAFQLNESLADLYGEDNGGQTEPEVEKVERPKAEAFVMAYCPYGLQFMKAYVPVMELLGDKADLEIRFVDYAMHGKKEIDGNSYIYCVQKEEKAKLPAYLRCALESGNYTTCVATAGIDSTKIGTCVSQLDTEYNLTGLFNDQSTWAGGQFPPYPVDAALNTQYGVGGSPTFVLNGNTVSVSRSAEAVKELICSSFITPPAECDTALRTEQESPGTGPVGSGTTTGGSASCG